MRTVVFDLDGTLADTAADMIAAANGCFSALGHGDVIDPVGDASTAFRGGRALLRLGFGRLGPLDEAAVDAQYPVFLDLYRDCLAVESRLYPGAADAVEALRGAGYATSICTNKPEAMAERLMAHFGVRDLFDALIGADTLPTRKPDPAPYRAAVTRAGGAVEASFLLGDTETDRKTARAAGVPCALVTFGPDGNGVADLAPDALLNDFSELSALTRSLIG